MDDQTPQVPDETPDTSPSEIDELPPDELRELPPDELREPALAEAAEAMDAEEAWDVAESSDGAEESDEMEASASASSQTEDRKRRRAHAHDPYTMRMNHAVFMIVYGLIGGAALLYGLYRLSAAPEPLGDYIRQYLVDFVIVIGIAAVFLGLATRRWLQWKDLESALPPRPTPSEDEPGGPGGEAGDGTADAAPFQAGMTEGSDAEPLPLATGAAGVVPGDDIPASPAYTVQAGTVPAGALATGELPRAAPEPAPPPLYGRREAVLAGALMAVGLLLALFGQIRLDASQLDALPGTGSLLVGLVFLAAGGLWLYALVRAPERVVDDRVPVVPGPRLDTQRLNALILGLFLVVFPAFVAPRLPVAGDVFGLLYYPQGFYPADLSRGVPVHPDSGTLTLFGGGMYLVGVLLVFWSLADWGRLRSRWRRVWDGEALHFRLSRTAIAVIAITLLGAWFRFHDLANLPYEMTSDHTEKLIDVRTILAGLRPVFMPANSGREPMQFYWTALLVAIGLPLTFMTLKIGMSIISTLTIPLIYRLGREVGDRELGLMAALVFALVPWHLQITRIALRIAFAPLWVAITLVFLYRALASGRRNDWLLTGAALGLGMYGYSAFRPMVIAVPLIILLKLAHDAFHRRRAGEHGALLSRPLAGHLTVAGGVAFLIVVPYMRYALDRWQAVFERTGTRMFQAEVAYEHPVVQQFLINLKNALLMFNLTSDTAWFQSPSARPALETVGGALLVLGLAVVLHRVWRRDWRLGTLVAIIPIMLLSSIMALAFPRENPSLSRASAALPMVVVLVALPLPVLAARWRAAWGSMGTLAYSVLLVVLFLWMGRETNARYFGEYRASYDNSTHPTSEGAEVIRAFMTQGGLLENAWYVSWPHGWDFRLLAINVGEFDWGNLMMGTAGDGSDAAEGARAHASDPAQKLYLVGGQFAAQQIETLKSIYPDAIVTQHQARMPGKEFWSVHVPERTTTPTPAPTATAPPTTTPPDTPAATEQTP